MAVEIERRWLIRRLNKKRLPRILHQEKIKDGYVEVSHPHQISRIRIADGQKAVMTFKSGVGISRKQSEHPVNDLCLAQWLMRQCDHSLKKVRHHLEGGWELNFFRPPLRGLILLELEGRLKAVQKVTLPDWAEGEEVTDSLTNLHLARMTSDLKGPYRSELRLIYRELLRKIPAIVLAGGPASGKDGVIDALKPEFSKVLFVPEVASIVIGQLGITTDETELSNARRQRAIYQTQAVFEASSADFAARRRYEGVVFNRGTIDGAGYLKGGVEDFEHLLHTSRQAEYARYGKVIFLGMPSQEVFEKHCHNNPVRREHSYAEAVAVSERSRIVWQYHAGYVYIPSTRRWEEKVEQVRREIRNFLNS